MGDDLDRVLEEVERLDRERQQLTLAAIGSPMTANLLADLTARAADAAPLLAAEVRRLRAGGCARDQRTTQFCAEAVAKDAEIVRLRAELTEALLTLAAEQGRQEGAPSERWYPEVRSGRVRWHRGDPDEAPEVSVFGLADGWRWTEPGHESRPYPTARAAMLTTGAAAG